MYSSTKRKSITIKAPRHGLGDIIDENPPMIVHCDNYDMSDDIMVDDSWKSRDLDLYRIQSAARQKLSETRFDPNFVFESSNIQPVNSDSFSVKQYAYCYHDKLREGLSKAVNRKRQSPTKAAILIARLHAKEVAKLRFQEAQRRGKVDLVVEPSRIHQEQQGLAYEAPSFEENGLNDLVDDIFGQSISQMSLSDTSRDASEVIILQNVPQVDQKNDIVNNLEPSAGPGRIASPDTADETKSNHSTELYVASHTKGLITSNYHDISDSRKTEIIPNSNPEPSNETDDAKPSPGHNSGAKVTFSDDIAYNGEDIGVDDEYHTANSSRASTPINEYSLASLTETSPRNGPFQVVDAPQLPIPINSKVPSPISAIYLTKKISTDNEIIAKPQYNPKVRLAEDSDRLDEKPIAAMRIQGSNRTYYPKTDTDSIACLKCCKKSEFWCQKCESAFCYVCWNKIAHHRQADLNEVLVASYSLPFHSRPSSSSAGINSRENNDRNGYNGRSWPSNEKNSYSSQSNGFSKDSSQFSKIFDHKMQQWPAAPLSDRYGVPAHAMRMFASYDHETMNRSDRQADSFVSPTQRLRPVKGGRLQSSFIDRDDIYGERNDKSMISMSDLIQSSSLNGKLSDERASNDSFGRSLRTQIKLKEIQKEKVSAMTPEEKLKRKRYLRRNRRVNPVAFTSGDGVNLYAATGQQPPLHAKQMKGISKTLLFPL